MQKAPLLTATKQVNFFRKHELSAPEKRARGKAGFFNAEGNVN